MKALLLLVLVAGGAEAARCPSVTILLDRSASMEWALDGSEAAPGKPSRMSVAQAALVQLMKAHGQRLPFGLATFSDVGLGCDAGTTVLARPETGSGSASSALANAITTFGQTNTGHAVRLVADDTQLDDLTRPARYTLLVTDGEPTCGPDPLGYAVAQLARASGAPRPVKTFVLGFGALPPESRAKLDQMALAGGMACTGASCQGHGYYAAETPAALTAALEAVSQRLVNEFNQPCDDSCYANACPSGQRCARGACAPDLCQIVRCEAGEYCFSDGLSARCARACPRVCPAGERCALSGACEPDPCAARACRDGDTCADGLCVAACEPVCAVGLSCIAGRCTDDPCRYVQCPAETRCEAGRGTCVGPAGGTRTLGCDARGAPAAPSAAALLVLASLPMLFGRLAGRRRSR